MTNQHPIAPSARLVEKWHDDWHKAKVKHVNFDQHIAIQAANWGADQQFDICFDWIKDFYGTEIADCMKEDLRPKVLNLKEEALSELDAVERLHPADYSTIRRALEQLDD